MSSGFDRRSFLARGAATAGLVLAGDLALEGNAFADGSNGPGRNGIGKGAPKHGGSLIIGTDSEDQGFNPSSGRFDATGSNYARAVFDPLMAVTASGGVVPYLAQSVSHNAEYTEWTINLRPGVTFHDGTPLTGAALEQNVDVQYHSALVGLALKPLVASYKQTGPLSVQITMKNPWVTFPYTLAEQQICFVAAPSMLNATNGGTDHPVGTGPFVYSDWVPNSHFTATANPHYWRKGLPYLDSVTFKPLPDAGSRADALQSGAVNLIYLSETQQILEFRNNKSYAYIDNSGPTVGGRDTNCLMLNTSKPPFNDPDLRLALAKGVNRNTFAKVIDNGVNPVSNGIFYPGSPYYSAHDGFPAYDVAGAKSLLKKVSQKQGGPVKFTMNAVSSPTDIRFAEYVQQVAQGLGVTVSINEVEQNDLIDLALSGSFEATEWSQFGAVSPDLNYIWFSTTTAHQSGLSINMSRNSDPRIEAAMQQGMQTTSQATRVAAWRKVQRLLNEDLPYIWADGTTHAIVSQPAAQNWANPTAPNGSKLLDNDQGVFWFTQAWI